MTALQRLEHASPFLLNAFIRRRRRCSHSSARCSLPPPQNPVDDSSDDGDSRPSSTRRGFRATVGRPFGKLPLADG
eukprot:8584315-Pyramimonas_sp.AAC.1